MELLRLGDLPPLIARYGAVVVIGDGPSKLRYIWHPGRVLTLAVNRAALDYPRAVAVVMQPHLDQVLAVLPGGVPLCYIGRFDMSDYYLDGGRWTSTILLNYLLRDTEAPIYLQGFDLSTDHYAQQAEQFERLVEHHPGRVSLVHPVAAMPTIVPVTPPTKLII